MYRGTTPLNIFTVDADLTNAEVIYITYKQGCKVVIEKDIDEIEVAADKLTVRLSQEDTLKFDYREVEIQIRARYPDETAIASNIIKTTVEHILKDGVI